MERICKEWYEEKENKGMSLTPKGFFFAVFSFFVKWVVYVVNERFFMVFFPFSVCVLFLFSCEINYLFINTSDENRQQYTKSRSRKHLVVETVVQWH